MKKFFFLPVAVCLLGAVGARAQQPQPIMKVNVPFEFHVGGEAFPAGQYTVMGNAFGRGFVQLTAPGKGTFAQVQYEITNKTVSQPKLVFHQVGGNYYLAQVWDARGRGKQIEVTVEERELARRSQPAETTVAAN
jgi:hypothetical protein